MLYEKGMLSRNFTQNIDTLERVAGIPADRLVEAHGSYSDAKCIDCELSHTIEFLKGGDS
jgi:NAD+-dependent protein deacetylase sirtuin 2